MQAAEVAFGSQSCVPIAEAVLEASVNATLHTTLSSQYLSLVFPPTKLLFDRMLAC